MVERYIKIIINVDRFFLTLPPSRKKGKKKKRENVE